MDAGRPYFTDCNRSATRNRFCASPQLQVTARRRSAIAETSAVDGPQVFGHCPETSDTVDVKSLFLHSSLLADDVLCLMRVAPLSVCRRGGLPIGRARGCVVSWIHQRARLRFASFCSCARGVRCLSAQRSQAHRARLPLVPAAPRPRVRWCGLTSIVNTL